MRLIGRWWNGSWARLWRRDLWLFHDEERDRWLVQARQGDSDSQPWIRAYPDEAAARAQLEAMLARGADEWRDLTPAAE